MSAALVPAALCLALSACAHPQAKTVATTAEVPLEVPAPPPRAVEPITADALPPVGPVGEPARNTPPRAPRAAQPAPTTPRTDVPRADAPRSDTTAPDASKPADDTAARPAAPGAPPAPTLQTTPAQNERDVEARVRAQLARAASDLNRVDYGKLSAAAKSQYDFAKRYVGQSEEAIRARNLPFAQALADKAADIAAQLAGR